MEEIKTDLFPERLRAGRKYAGAKKAGESGGQGGIHKNAVISVETLTERTEKKDTRED